MKAAASAYLQYPAFNTVLTDFLKRANSMGIYVEYELEPLPEHLPMDEHELAKLASAILDTATASCRLIPNPADRWISLRLYSKADELCADSTAAGAPVDMDAANRMAKSCGGQLRLDRYDDSYHLAFITQSYYVTLVDPFPDQREELAALIRESLTGRVFVRHYSGVGDCPQKALCHCHAVFITLNSVEDVVSTYRLHPNGERWPLVVVTNHERFGLDAQALWAQDCLLRPLSGAQVAEALRRCLETVQIENRFSLRGTNDEQE